MSIFHVDRIPLREVYLSGNRVVTKNPYLILSFYRNYIHAREESGLFRKTR